MTTLHAVVCVCVCADAMQMIGCHDSAAVVAADNIDVNVTVVSVADDGQVTVDIDAYAALYCLFYRDAVWLGSRVVSVLDSGAVGPGFKSQPRCRRVTVLGKLFTPIAPLFTKQQKW